MSPVRPLISIPPSIPANNARYKNGHALGSFLAVRLGIAAVVAVALRRYLTGYRTPPGPAPELLAAFD